jgi:hypothetical protein
MFREGVVIVSGEERLREATASCLSLCVSPPSSARVFALPFYMVPVEIFTRGMLIRPSYVRGVVLVDGLSAVATLLDGAPSLEERRIRAEWLLPRLSVREAESVAQRIEVGSGRSGGVFRFSRVSSVHVREEDIRLVWRVWFQDEAHGMVDAFSGDRVEKSDLMSLFLSGLFSSVQKETP